MHVDRYQYAIHQSNSTTGRKAEARRVIRDGDDITSRWWLDGNYHPSLNKLGSLWGLRITPSMKQLLIPHSTRKATWVKSEEQRLYATWGQAGSWGFQDGLRSLVGSEPWDLRDMFILLGADFPAIPEEDLGVSRLSMNARPTLPQGYVSISWQR